MRGAGRGGSGGAGAGGVGEGLLGEAKVRVVTRLRRPARGPGWAATYH